MLNTYTVIAETYRAARNLLEVEGFPCLSRQYQCAYWNSHILQNCSVYDQHNNSVPPGEGAPADQDPRAMVASSLASVQSSILEGTLGDRYDECTGRTGFCQPPTSLISQ